MNRTIAHFHWRAYDLRVFIAIGLAERRKADGAFGDNGFQTLYEIFVGRAANVSGAVVVVIGEDAADFAVLFDTASPVVLMMFLRAVLIDAGQRPHLILQMHGFFNVIGIRLMAAFLFLI